MSYRDPNDITANYHGGNPNSVEANRTTRKTIDLERITDLLRRNMGGGLTCDEVEVELGMGHQTASARLTEMKRNEIVVVVGRRKTRRGSNAGVNFLKADLDAIGFSQNCG